MTRTWHFLRALSPELIAGVLLLAALAAFAVLGNAFYDGEMAFPLSAPPARAPSMQYPFGTDSAGRDLFAVIVQGTITTAKIGVIAGGIGLALGTAFAFIAAYLGGWVDRLITFVVDVLLTVPGILVLVVLASSIRGQMDTTLMALVIAALAWREPTRQIRAQAVVMREMPYIGLARLSGMRAAGIIVIEMIPNLLPYLAASFVGSVASAMLASVGLEALGLGSPNEATLGNTIYWLMSQAAFMRGLWWWIVEPVAVLVIIFVGLYLVSSGLDEVANPRLRRRA
jgi:peptide/nickel transport system permease protein